jgi:Lysyl oxidase
VSPRRLFRTRRDRRSAAAGALALSCLTLLISAASAGPGWAAAGDPLRPDLVTRPHTELFVHANQLRLSNTVADKGIGPLEIYPEPTAGNDCDGDGDPTNDRYAFQRVFKDSSNSSSPGYFVRGQDTPTTSRRVGCMVFHPTHHHWHLEDFARYNLKRESTGALASQSTKIGFCVTDGEHLFPSLPGSSGADYYGACQSASTEGISIGWADTYGAYLDGQSINIGGLPAAKYCLVSRVDPSDRLAETIESNNARRTRIYLDPASETVKRLSGTCQLS